MYRTHTIINELPHFRYNMYYMTLHVLNKMNLCVCVFSEIDITCWDNDPVGDEEDDD